MHVVAARPVAGVNKGFERQLRAYGVTNYDVYASQQVLLLSRLRSLHALRSACVAERERQERQDREAAGVRASSPASTESGSSGHKRGYHWSAQKDGMTETAEEVEEEGEEEDEREGLGLMDLSASPRGAAVIPLHLPHSGVGHHKAAHELGLGLGHHKAAHELGLGLGHHKAAHAEQFDSFTSMPTNMKRAGSAPMLTGSGLVGPAAAGSSSSSPAGSRGISPSPRGGTCAASMPIISEGPAPHVRLTRPGSTSVRVIPPLRGLERRYCCSWCGADLFSLASVIRIDLLLAERERRRDSNVASSAAENKHGHTTDRGAQQKGGFYPDMPPPNGSPKSGMRLSPVSLAAQRGPKFFPADEKSQSGSAPGGLAAAAAILRAEGFNQFAASGGLQSSRNRDSKGAKGFNFMDLDEGADLGGGNGNGLGHGHGHGDGLDARPDSKADDSSPRFGQFQAKEGKDESDTPRLSIPPSRDYFKSSAASAPWAMSSSSSSPLSPTSASSPAVALASSPMLIPSLAGIPPIMGGGDAMFRPQSAERRRWLERVNLLRSSASGTCVGNAAGGVGGPSAGEGKLHKIALVAAQDYSASQVVEVEGMGGGGKYLYLEYCPWMGQDPLRGIDEQGYISCKECKKAIGLWSWQPSDRQRLDGLMEPPLFRILKDSVSQTPLTLDATPTSTPRLEEEKG